MLRRRLERGSADPTVNQVVDCNLLAMREIGRAGHRARGRLALCGVVVLARHHPQVAVGASPRAELDLVNSRARALLLRPGLRHTEDVKGTCDRGRRASDHIAPGVMGAQIAGADVVSELLRHLPFPRLVERSGLAG